MTDLERGYKWRALGNTGQGLANIAEITIGGRKIPYEYTVDPERDESTEWYDYRLGVVGSSLIGRIKYGLEPITFSSEEDRDAVIIVVIEATLAYEPGGLVPKPAYGFCRMTFRGVRYKLSDFGPYYGATEDGRQVSGSSNR